MKQLIKIIARCNNYLCNNLHLSLLVFITCLSFNNQVLAQCNNGNCYTDVLDLSTGVEHDPNTVTNFYGNGVSDQFWRCNPISGGTNLATSQGFSRLGSPVKSQSLIHNTGISQTGTFWPGPNNPVNGNSFIFTREFRVCNTGSANLDIKMQADWFIKEATITQWNPPGNGGQMLWTTIPPGPTSGCTGSAMSVVNNTINSINFTPGIYFLAIRVENDYSNCVLGSGSTDMWMECAATLTPTVLGSNIFASNQVNGIQTVGHQYPLNNNFVITNTASNPCLLSSATGQITPYVASTPADPIYYQVIAPNGATQIISATGTFPMSSPGTYSLNISNKPWTGPNVTAGCFRTITYSLNIPAFVPIPNFCITTNNTGTVTANLLTGSPSCTYKLNNGAFQGTGTFTGLGYGTGQQIYTITAQDVNTPNCTATATFIVFKNTVTNTLASSLSCVVGTQPFTITSTATTSFPGLTYNFGTGLTPVSGSSNLATGIITSTIGTFAKYTVIATDANGCTKSSSITINKSNLTTSLSASPTCLPAGLSSTLQAFPSSNYGISTITFSNGVLQNGTNGPTGGTFIAGVYTVTVSDAQGCKATSTVQIQSQAAINLITPPLPCWKGFPATGAVTCVLNVTNGAPSTPIIIKSTIVGGANLPVQTAIATSIPAGTTFTLTGLNGPPVPLPTASITYTVTVGTSNNCAVTPLTFTLLSCNPPPPPPPINCSNIANLTTISCAPTGTQASTIAALGGSTWITTPLLIKGKLIIDIPTNIINNPNVFLDKDAEIQLSNGATGGTSLTITNSKLKACAADMWYGITVYQSKIKINNSEIWDMKVGVLLTKLSTINADNNKFINNGLSSINFMSNQLSNTTSVNRIVNNTFESHATIGLLAPFVGSKGTSGIRSLGSCGLDIGKSPGSTGNPAEPNTFKNLNNGIFISGNGGQYNDFYINGNYFTNIQNYNLTSPYDKIQSPFANEMGAAVYVSKTNGNVDIIGVDWTYPYKNCDKAIVVQNVKNLKVAFNQIDDCLIGVNTQNNTATTFIDFNKMTNTNFGITTYKTCNASGANLLVSRNEIKTASVGIVPASGTNYLWPIGVNAHEDLYTAIGGTGSITSSIIELNAPKGVGIQIDQMNRNFTVDNNLVKLLNTSTITAVPGYVSLPPVGELGIWINNCVGSNILSNGVKGQFTSSIYTLSPQPHPSAGIYFNNSIGSGGAGSVSSNLTIQCNHISQTERGFMAVGDIKNISATNITNNGFNANKYPWYTSDMASTPGTFGDVGKAAGSAGFANGFDCNNEFYKPTSIAAWSSPSPVAVDLRASSGVNKINVFRFTSLAPIYSDKIYTDLATCGLNNSKAFSNTANIYGINNPTSPAKPAACTGIIPNVSKMSHALVAEDRDLIKEVANDEEMAKEDSLTYNDFEKVQLWLEDYNLYAKLDADNTYRALDPDLAGYYAEMQGTAIQQLHSFNKDFAQLATTATDDFEYNLGLMQLQNSNAQIPIENDWIAKEQQLNAIVLDNMYWQTPSFSEDDIVFIAQLANSCPLVNANATFKARAIYNTIVPGTQYDDRVLCSNNSSRTSASDTLSLDQKEAQAIDALLAKEHEALVAKNTMGHTITLYPNPGQDLVHVRYNCNKPGGVFMVYNQLGVLILQVNIPEQGNAFDINTSKLTDGLYSYKVQFTECPSECGKLIIKH
jgi:hypothetical protein